MFGLILPGRALVDPSTLQSLSATQHAYTISSQPPFSHLVLFLLPGTQLPPDTAAAIYIRLPWSTQSSKNAAGNATGTASSTGDSNSTGAGSASAGQNEFQLLGAIDANKPSAIFRVRPPKGAEATGSGASEPGNEIAEVDMDADESSSAPAAPSAPSGVVASEIVVGISIEPVSTLAPQLAALKQRQEEQAQASAAQTAATANTPGIMAVYRPGQTGSSQGGPGPPSTKVLAQRIIRNAFNFLASFSNKGSGPGSSGEETIPLKSFEAWWQKFQRRIEADPGFLERDDD